MRATLIPLGAVVCGFGLAACGQATTTTVGQTSTSTTTTSLTTTDTVVHHAGTVTIHDTTTVTQTQTAGPVASQGQTSANGVLTLTGQGTENMGTVSVPSQSLLRWSCPSCSNDNFVVGNNVNDSNHVDVNALDQTSDQTIIDAGTYHDFQVEGRSGPWTITIGPSS
jgi:hypothetical protein